MNHQPKDALDREIDEVLASIAVQEPRRVNAASVRQAMEGRRTVPLPVWFATAAILILAVGGVVKNRTPAEKAPEVIARSGAARSAPEARTTPSIEPESAGHTLRSRLARRPGSGAATAAEPPFEALPRLVVAEIDSPEPLSTGLLSGESIVIPRIEIAPLVVSSLPNDHQPKP